MGYMPQAPKKNSKGLIIGLIIGGVVLVAAAVVLVILLTGGTSVAGLWYSEEYGEVLKFKDNGSFTVYMYDGDQKGEYVYDKAKGAGVITVEDTEYTFTVNKDEIIIEGTRVYKNAGEDFDIDEFLNDTALASPTPEVTIEPTATPQVSPTAVIESVTDMSMTLSFAFGERTGTYTGETVDGLPNGYGSFSTVSQDGISWVYEGDWVSGHFSGQGTTTWGDGFTESGQYQNDSLNGQGSEYWNGVLQYEGSYVNSTFNGQGTFYNCHGEAVYSGSWANGYIQETAEARSARIGAFKDQSIPATCDELYQACANDTSIRAQVSGVVFDIYEYVADQQYYCDFLMYEQGIEDTAHIVKVCYMLSEGEPTVTDGQTVTVWGTTEDIYSYTSESNEDLNVPRMEAWSVE